MIDKSYFNKISETYLKIREINFAEFLYKWIFEKIDFLRANSYSQMENVDYLPKKTTTFDDDGSFKSWLFKKIGIKNTIKTQETESETLVVSKTKGKTILTSSDKMKTQFGRSKLLDCRTEI